MAGPAEDSSEHWGDANTVLEVKQPRKGFACTVTPDCHTPSGVRKY